jgi:predicted O-methyltransferase YrrM
MPDWRDVDGWMSEAEGAVLRSLAVGMNVLEIGSYKGRSTVAMASVAKRLISVDHHRGDDGTGPSDTLREFLANLGAYGVRDRVIPIVAAALDAAPFLAPHAFDLAFVDAAHDAATTEACTRLALRCLKPGGTIAWHDWNYPAVREGVTACGLNPASVVDTLAWTATGTP